jgi:hypothetical protein
MVIVSPEVLPPNFWTVVAHPVSAFATVVLVRKEIAALVIARVTGIAAVSYAIAVATVLPAGALGW